jgi:hypothetical protein
VITSEKERSKLLQFIQRRKGNWSEKWAWEKWVSLPSCLEGRTMMRVSEMEESISEVVAKDWGEAVRVLAQSAFPCFQVPCSRLELHGWVHCQKRGKHGFWEICRGVGKESVAEIVQGLKRRSEGLL